MKTPEVVNLSLDEKDLLLESLANETLSKEQREHLKAIVLSFTEETGLSPYLVPLSFEIPL